MKIIGTAIKEGSSIPGPRGEVAIHKLELLGRKSWTKWCQLTQDPLLKKV